MFSCAPGNAKTELEFGSSADINVQLRSDLRRHILRDHAGGVVAGRQQIEGEAAFGVGRGRVASAGGRADDRDAGSGNAQVVKIDDRPVNGAGGGILRGSQGR